MHLAGGILRTNMFFIISVAVMALLVVIVVFFLNKFLYVLHGYDTNSANTVDVRSFKVYKVIYRTKVIVVFIGFLLSIAELIYARRVLLQYPNFGYTILYGICWLIVAIFVLACLALIFLPKGPLV